MAYRDQPEPHQAPYASSYDGAYDSRTYYDRVPQYQNPVNGRSRASSSAASDGHQQPIQHPLKNAIGNAFDKSDAARIVDPELIAQITAEVKKSVLDEIKLSGMVGSTQSQPPVPPTQYVPPSPVSTSSASVPPRDVYTPPSPKHTDSHSQPPPTADPLFRDPVLDGKDDTPTPQYGRSAPIDIPQERSSVRPAHAARMATDDYTPIEKMWQRLFDEDGYPLPRLGEFLRGLALHLIEDYEPKKSLVIPPAKMLKFYDEVKLHDEIYPWQTIFGKISYSSLSKIYRDMRCQHHLIQEHPAEQPYIPALTPEGFQEWMTAMIQAYPEVEYERLAKAVLAMPISNADDRKERFPKELPRRLFPTVENLQAQQRCAANLSTEGVGPLRKAPSFPPPPPKSQASSAPTTVPNLERERSPYVSRPETTTFESDDELGPSSVPIERQRQPYSAAPGGGRTYDDDLGRSTYSDTAAHEQRKRAQSTASQSQWAPPPHDQYHPQPQHPRTGSTANTRRPRSPSFSGYGASSEPNVRDIPSSYYTSNMHDFDEDGRRYSKDPDGKRHDRHRRSTAGIDGSFDSQPRSGYDDDDYRGRHGSNGYDNRGYESRRY